MDKIDEAFEVDPDSWYAKRYLGYLKRKHPNYWRSYVPNESNFENFCHFWRVVLIWETWDQFWAAKIGRIPLWVIITALAYLGITIAFPIPVLGVTGIIIGCIALVVGIVAGLVKAGDWYESCFSWETRDKIDIVVKILLFGSLVFGILALIVYTFILDPWFMIVVVGALAGGAVVIYLGYRALLAVPEPVYQAVGNFGSNVVLPKLSRNVARPTRQTASFIWGIIRSAKHKICPRVIFRGW